jgi:2,4-dienoyl-CoA reductase-like NADH-dependent reductase (Old Yellow Enzyme family)
LITTASCRVSREFEKASIDPFVPHLIVDSKLYTDWIQELAEGVHDYGAKLSVQLMAGLGRVLSREEMTRMRAIAPSSVPCFADPHIMTREMR